MTNQEQEPGDVREMNFTGEMIHWDLQNNVKLLSLRLPGKYDFARGERIRANCVESGVKVDLVVIDNVTKPLMMYYEQELLLDGYWEAMEARDHLKTFKGKYAEVELETPMQGVVTITVEAYEALEEAMKERLMKEGALMVFRDVDRPLKHLLYPALCRFAAAKGEGIDGWWNFLLDNDLMYLHEVREIVEWMGEERYQMLIKGGPEYLQVIWEMTEEELYRRVVLLEK